jgi:NAD(P)-dependent dehydrogenase (short-subunit alcohol dehydrogenase family)
MPWKQKIPMSKTFVVVGASSGIGYAIAQNLLAKGNRVITIGRSTPNLVGNHHYQADVLADALENIPAPESINGLVYAPGSINLKPFRGLKISDFQADLNVNLLGAISVLHWAQKSFATDASVVLFSTVAVQQGMPFHASVAAAKGAVEGLVRSLAAEWAPKVRVNAIAPSLTDTPLADRLINTEAKREAAAKRHPLQRIGTAEDVANAALFLLSDESRWMTGQILGVDGGMSAVKVG